MMQFSCSDQETTSFVLIINFKMPTIVCILILLSVQFHAQGLTIRLRIHCMLMNGRHVTVQHITDIMGINVGSVHAGLLIILGMRKLTSAITTRQLAIQQYTPMKHLKISCQKHKIDRLSLLLSSRCMTNSMKSCSFLHAHFFE